MYKLLIFGGTTEGRLLAEFCVSREIYADVSVTTDYAAGLIPQSRYIEILNGQLDRAAIETLLSAEKYCGVIDATHPYAVTATANISAACAAVGIPYYRHIREKSNNIPGRLFSSLSELVEYLNSSTKRVLSTLGSKELPVLSKVCGYSERIWARVLPAAGIMEYCKGLGFSEGRIILGSPPFSFDENVSHIRKSGAEILVTKESGAVGGYPEKAAAARECGVELVTLLRPQENGYTLKQIQQIISEIIK